MGKAKTKITYQFFKGCNNTPAIPFIYQAHHDLHTKGFGVDSLNFSHDSMAFVAFDGDAPVGIILFDEYGWRNTLYVLLGYVAVDFRGQGIYSELWKRLVARAQECKFPTIEGGTHINNIAMQQVMEAQGRVATHISYTFKVPKAKVSRKAVASPDKKPIV